MFASGGTSESWRSAFAVEPSKRSESKLTGWVGQRGVESKGHHAVTNHANGGIRNGLADSLSLAGIAFCNLSIRERMKIDRMSANERAKIPHAFRGVLAHANHSRLHCINQQSGEAIGKVVHDCALNWDLAQTQARNSSLSATPCRCNEMQAWRPTLRRIGACATFLRCRTGIVKKSTCRNPAECCTIKGSGCGNAASSVSKKPNCWGVASRHSW
jgi:hypothetical protein